ncbi:hypothetical protein ACUY3K_02335 [Corynebacterium uberis]|uniref:hypothetical protein n=1 Tax=Corynebacterium TaxID=1716 RepID=UPI001D0B788B|nr:MULTISPECIES: hypothetical protein [Corynebacterium]MCZ9309929.1 hypothetical protein [Corynebacterium sp. c6VSa_13]UDL73150.1 hypothetical protein LH391_08540 [Corynebacterium uberis]UDL75973.1 hypothetical protein LH393_00850 [Corynebacterium uberis]UDL78185.1 hypothetical protein LH394_00845 [Corynebacterium uberis]UDL80468.1 hypothetical protein LH392_01275 [Corynebacterium uberis]
MVYPSVILALSAAYSFCAFLAAGPGVARHRLVARRSWPAAGGFLAAGLFYCLSVALLFMDQTAAAAVVGLCGLALCGLAYAVGRRKTGGAIWR